MSRPFVRSTNQPTRQCRPVCKLRAVRIKHNIVVLIIVCEQGWVGGGHHGRSV